MTFPVDLQADALLRTLLAQNGGDLRAALTLLCARVAVEDLSGETFEQALARAVASLFSRWPLPFEREASALLRPSAEASPNASS